MWIQLLFCTLGFGFAGGLIWWIGPLISLGESAPLQEDWTRILAVFILGLLIFLPLIHKWLRNKRAELELNKALTESDEKVQVQDSKLESIFAEAIRTLTQSTRKQRKAGGQGIQQGGKWNGKYLQSWWKRVLSGSEKGLYQMPWYVFIGPPGSGKTTALMNSGLRFPLQHKLGVASIKGVGGTRQCDWWFSEEAVWIDTAGRFTTQDSDPQTDAAGWKRFLSLLKTHRPLQPLNGVVLTLSATDLLADEQSKESIFNRIRLRLQELVNGLGMCPPVYFLITKLDHVSGFEESFELLSKDAICQGWGVNFDYGKPLGDILSRESEGALQASLQALLTRLDQHIVERMENEAATHRRSNIFGFPHELGRLFPHVLSCVQQIFAGQSVFEKQVTLRGIYLSSGTQFGTGLDRLVGEFSNGGSSPKGRAYFIEGLLKQVILAERHLASWSKRHVRLQWLLLHGGALLSAAILILTLLAWASSYSNNTSWLDSIKTKASGLEEKAKNLSEKDEDSREALLRIMDDLETLSLFKGQEKDFPWTYQMGLNQTANIQKASQSRYTQILDESLIPRIYKSLEFQLQRDVENNSDTLRSSLKAYLMMSLPAHYKAEELWPVVEKNWSSSTLRGMPDEDQAKALRHLKAAIDKGAPARLPETHTGLVRGARQQLSQLGPEELIFQGLKAQVEAMNLGHFDAIRRVGPELSSVLVREGGKPLQDGPSSFYTREGFLKGFSTQLAVNIQMQSDEYKWVMGEEDQVAGGKLSFTDLSQRIREMYVTAYIQEWENYLSQIRVRPIGQLTSAVELARIMASPNSTLKRFMKEVSEETTLVGQTERVAQAVGDRVVEAVNRKANVIPRDVLKKGMDKEVADSLIERRVDEHFFAIHQLFKDKNTGYTEIEALFNRLYTQLSAVLAAQRGKTLAPDPAVFLDIQSQAGLLPEPMRSMITQLGTRASEQNESARKNQLSTELTPALDMCRRMTEGRYPFSSQSSLDVLPEDFVRLFARQGLIQELQTVQAQNSHSGKSLWHADSQSQFDRAKKIQEIFLPNGTKAGFSVEVRLLNSSNPNDTFYWEQDGKLLMFSQQFDPKHTVNWQLNSGSGDLKLRSSDDSNSVVYKGPWSLFRFLDAGQVHSGSGPERFQFTYRLNGKVFEFEMISQSTLNPLRMGDLKQFRCPRVS